MSNYSQFIQEKGKKTREYNYQKHHIIPKSLGGSDDKENIVWLSIEDHAWAHILYDLENGTNTSKLFVLRIAGKIGILLPLEDIRYEDCLFLKEVEPMRKKIISQTQKNYWANPEKRRLRVSQFSEAKKGKVNVCVNRKWVHKGEERHRVNPEEINKWIDKGFRLGIWNEN